jgi:hypothetical protein
MADYNDRNSNTDRRTVLRNAVGIGLMTAGVGTATTDATADPRYSHDDESPDTDEFSIRFQQSLDSPRGIVQIEDEFIVATAGQVIRLDHQAEIVWAQPTAGRVLSLAASDDSVFVGTNNGVQRLTQMGMKTGTDHLGQHHTVLQLMMVFASNPVIRLSVLMKMVHNRGQNDPEILNQ